MTLETKPGTRSIVVDEVLPHAQHIVWKALTDGALMGRWLMEPKNFNAVVGCKFTYLTKAAGAWDGTIYCEVLDVVANERLSYAWRGGDKTNEGYGSQLDTVVTFILSAVGADTRLRLVHCGFERPKNDIAYEKMSEGWKTVISRLEAVASEQSLAIQKS